MQQKKRMANLELLRIIAMMMIVVLHYLGKGHLLPLGTTDAGGLSVMDGQGYLAWLLEAFCIVAVNLYMLISGYFLSESTFKLSRLLGIWFQILFYSVGVGMLAVALGLASFDLHYLFMLVLPVSMEHYWFMTAYCFFYLLLPLLGIAVKNMGKEQLKVTIIALFTVFSVLKSVLPIYLETDQKGYDFMWYIILFLIAAYYRRYGIAWLEHKQNAMILYIAGCLLAFVETIVLHTVYVKTGRFELIYDIAMNYNHIFVTLAAIGLFAASLKWNIEGKFATAVCRIAPYTLGVYLLHENYGVRYAWQNWLGADSVSSVGELLLYVLVSVVVVFTIGILVDMLRSLLFRGVGSLLRRIPVINRIYADVDKVDSYFQNHGKNE